MRSPSGQRIDCLAGVLVVRVYGSHCGGVLVEDPELRGNRRQPGALFRKEPGHLGVFRGLLAYSGDLVEDRLVPRPGAYRFRGL